MCVYHPLIVDSEAMAKAGQCNVHVTRKFKFCISEFVSEL